MRTVMWLTAAGAAALIGAGKSPDGDFRRADWKMTMEQVKGAETKAALQAGALPDQLVYSGTLLGELPVRITYGFSAGKLVRGTCYLPGPLKLAHYAAIRRALEQEYGPPRSDVSPVGTGLGEATWVTPKTEIDLVIRAAAAPAPSPAVDSIEINYYDLAFSVAQGRETKKEEAQDRTTDRMEKFWTGWVEVAPGCYWEDF